LQYRRFRYFLQHWAEDCPKYGEIVFSTALQVRR
jgi:hypothetical protein